MRHQLETRQIHRSIERGTTPPDGALQPSEDSDPAHPHHRVGKIRLERWPERVREIRVDDGLSRLVLIEGRIGLQHGKAFPYILQYLAVKYLLTSPVDRQPYVDVSVFRTRGH